MATKDTKRMINFRGYRPMSEEDAIKKRLIKRSPVVDDTFIPVVPDVIQEMFAPDPETGNPSSDFFIRASADDDIRQYIDTYLMQNVVTSPRSNDVDLALDTTKSRFESIQEYFQRVKGMFTDNVK